MDPLERRDSFEMKELLEEEKGVGFETSLENQEETIRLLGKELLPKLRK